MRVLLAHNNYSITGGAEVFYHEVGRVLQLNGHEVAWFSSLEKGAETPWADYFPPVADYSRGGGVNRALAFPKMVYNVDAKRAMSRLIKDFRPDIIHAFAIYVRLTPSILDAAREAGVPVVLSCNDYKHLCPNYKLFHHGHLCEECRGGRYYRALMNRCCHDSAIFSAASMIEAYVHSGLDVWRKNVSCFLFASEFMARKTEEFWGRGRVNIDFLRNPFNADKHHVDAHVGNYILYFGRLIDEKGVELLIDAAALAPDVPVVVVGDGPQREELEERARDLANVRLVGAAWGDDLARWLHDARAVVVPSLWYENFPYVILQAFAAAKTVIGSDRGGIPELVRAGPHGWIYDALDAADLARQLQAVHAMPDAQLLEMGLAAQQYVAREFTDEVIYQRLLSIYQKVLA